MRASRSRLEYKMILIAGCMLRRGRARRLFRTLREDMLACRGRSSSCRSPRPVKYCTIYKSFHASLELVCITRAHRDIPMDNHRQNLDSSGPHRHSKNQVWNLHRGSSSPSHSSSATPTSLASLSPLSLLRFSALKIAHSVPTTRILAQR